MTVVDWPTSVQRQERETTGWNFYFTGWGTQPALGALATMKFLESSARQPEASARVRRENESEPEPGSVIA